MWPVADLSLTRQKCAENAESTLHLDELRLPNAMGMSLCDRISQWMTNPQIYFPITAVVHCSLFREADRTPVTITNGM